MSCDARPRHEVVLAATLFLMTRFQSQRCPCIARAVVEHLDLLARECNGPLPAWLRSVCAQLQMDWRVLSRDTAPALAKPSGGSTH